MQFTLLAHAHFTLCLNTERVGSGKEGCCSFSDDSWTCPDWRNRMELWQRETKLQLWADWKTYGKYEDFFVRDPNLSFADGGEGRLPRGQFFKAGKKAKLGISTGGRDLFCKDISSKQFYSLHCYLSHLAALRFPYVQSSLVIIQWFRVTIKHSGSTYKHLDCKWAWWKCTYVFAKATESRDEFQLRL